MQSVGDVLAALEAKVRLTCARALDTRNDARRALLAAQVEILRDFVREMREAMETAPGADTRLVLITDFRGTVRAELYDDRAALTQAVDLLLAEQGDRIASGVLRYGHHRIDVPPTSAAIMPAAVDLRQVLIVELDGRFAASIHNSAHERDEALHAFVRDNALAYERGEAFVYFHEVAVFGGGGRERRDRKGAS